MAYDPADLRLPSWLLAWLDAWVQWRIPLGWGYGLGFTRPGIIFSLVLGGVWLAAIYSGNNLLYVCASMLSAIMIFSLSLAWRVLRLGLMNLAHVSWPQLTAGMPFAWQWQRPIRAAPPAIIELELQTDASGPDQRQKLAGRIDRRSDDSCLTLFGALRMEKRGIFSIRQGVLQTAAPVGLFVLQHVFSMEDELLVMPQPVKWQVGGNNGGIRGRQAADEWSDLRLYIPGDPLSRVHWRKAASGLQQWRVKRFVAAADNSFDEILCVDLRPAGGVHAESAFENLLGRAWFWMQTHPAAKRLCLGRRIFELHDSEQRYAAVRALAAAVPEMQPPDSGCGGIVISAAGGRR